jgi:site-specific recombinase XerD
MQTVVSLDAKPEMKEQITEYILSLHNTSDGTKEQYASYLRQFANYLMSVGIGRFEEVTKKDIDHFISTKLKQNTRNLYIFAIKSFYKNYLGMEDKVKHLRQKQSEEMNITPSELLTPEEVIQLANEAGKRRDMYKVLILTLFESCARINELLELRHGDAIFSSVVDKEGKRKLIATLHFKRAKGNINKQPVVLTMFASELKRWVENHPFKGNGQAYLFPSPYSDIEPVEYTTIEVVLYNAGERLGIKKRVNPHWLRHSGLSYFSNNLNYNEQLLMWRAGWKSTQMAKRYIHSGAELEGKAYLQRMGYLVEEKDEKKILPKTCPHCQAINPYTNTNCDFCAMPLDLEEYKKEIEKKRKITELYDDLDSLSKGKLTEEQEAMLKSKTETITKLIELGRDDLAEQYIEKLLESWVKTFLTA